MRIYGSVGRGKRSVSRVIRHSRSVKMRPSTPTPATPARRGNLFRAPAAWACAAVALAVVAVVGTAWARSADVPARDRSNPQPTTRPASVESVSDATPELATYKVKADRPATPAERAQRSESSNELLHDAAAPAEEVAAPAAPRRVRSIRMQVTAYCPCKKCCGPDAKGLTASGQPISYNGGAFVAADTSVLPFGTKLEIPGYHAGRPVEVLDRGGAIRGHRLDVFFPTHKEALEWGRQWVMVNVVE